MMIMVMIGRWAAVYCTVLYWVEVGGTFDARMVERGCAAWGFL